MKKTVKFHTLGCKVNQYETQSIRERFINAGFKESSDGSPADVYVINTCTVTASADRKSRNIIRKCIRENPAGKVIVTGCMVERDTDILSRIKGVNIIIRKCFFPEGISNFAGHSRAFIKIQDGCDNSCSYCKVTIIRGPCRSRILENIIREAEVLVNQGFQEIVLTGICLGSYGKDLLPPLTLVDVINELEKIKNLKRLRLSSIEISNVSDELIEKMRVSEILCPHLHIPMQSGDDYILKRMNRPYQRKDYSRIIEKIKRKIPDIGITTDVIVGFPGENETNFRNTVELVKKTVPLKVHIFPYSPREQTAAFRLGKQPPVQVVKSRKNDLYNAAQRCSDEFREKFLNKKVDVLIEEPADEKPGYWQGYTGNYMKVLLLSDKCLKNKHITLQIKKIEKDYCLGEPV